MTNIFPINNKTDHICLEKTSKTKVDIFPIIGLIWSRIRINIKMKGIRNTDFRGLTRIHIKIKRICNTAFIYPNWWNVPLSMFP